MSFFKQEVVVLDDLFEKPKEVEKDDISIVLQLTFGKAKEEVSENQQQLSMENSEDSSSPIPPGHHIDIDTKGKAEDIETAKSQTIINYQDDSVPNYILETDAGSVTATKFPPPDLDSQMISLDSRFEGSEDMTNSAPYVQLEQNGFHGQYTAMFSSIGITESDYESGWSMTSAYT